MIAARRSGSGRLFASAEAMEGIIHARLAESEREGLLSIGPDAWEPGSACLTVPRRYTWTPKATHGNIPMLPEAREILLRRKAAIGDTSPFVFPHPDGGWLRSDYWQTFKFIVKAAGLNERIRVHDLRHTFGMMLRSSGARLESIMGVLRHRSIDESAVYARYTEEEGAKAVAAISGYAG